MTRRDRSRPDALESAIEAVFAPDRQTQRLKHVQDITEADLAEIDAGMTVCSKWLPGHALAQAMNEPLPEPAELLAEIQRLDSFTQAMRERGRS